MGSKIAREYAVMLYKYKLGQTTKP